MVRIYYLRILLLLLKESHGCDHNSIKDIILLGVLFALKNGTNKIKDGIRFNAIFNRNDFAMLVLLSSRFVSLSFLIAIAFLLHPALNCTLKPIYQYVCL